MTIEQKWQQLYRGAVLETDRERIQARIEEAETAIKERLHEFALNHGGTPEENRAIADALKALGILRSEVPYWKVRK